MTFNDYPIPLMTFLNDLFNDIHYYLNTNPNTAINTDAEERINE